MQKHDAAVVKEMPASLLVAVTRHIGPPTKMGPTRFKLQKQVSVEPRKKPSYFPLYWLVNRDPYNGL